MIHLPPSDVARCERQLATEEEGDGEMASTSHAHGDGLSPADVCWRDGDLDVRRIEAGSAQFHGNAITDKRVIFPPFYSDASPDRRGRLLTDPHINQAAELNNAKQH